MDLGVPALEVGAALRQDAVGEWLSARLEGTPRTLRILRADLAEREDARLLFREEIRRIARIDHRALLHVHRVHDRPPRPWMLTDPIDGATLQQFVEAEGALPPETALALACDLASAFGYLEGRKQAHAAPIPARVVQVEGRWRLLTFRDIRAWDEVKTLKGKRPADPAFSPPERERDHPESLRPHPFVAYALGGLLRFAAGGGPPRAPDGAAAPLPTAFPGALAEVVRRLTDEQPTRRLQGPRAIEALLRGEGAAAQAPESAASTPPIQAPVPQRRKRRR